MGAESKIGWTDATFSAWLGCTKVSPACDHCYAEDWAKRYGKGELWQGKLARTSKSNWYQPLKWNAECRKAGTRRRVFCSSLSDVFDNQADPAWRCDLWDLIWQCESLDFLLLTKRPQNIAKMLPQRAKGALEDWGDGWDNVSLGVTAENQQELDRRAPILLSVPARRRFLSCEPLLGPLRLDNITVRTPDSIYQLDALRGEHYLPGCGSVSSQTFTGRPRIDWVITGGESGGPKARPSHPQWFRDIRDQCVESGTAFFHKQNGEWVSVSEVEGPGEHFTFPDGATVRRVGTKRSGNTIDGVTWEQLPRGLARAAP